MLVEDRAPPAVALAELKAHLRLEDSAEDALLIGWLRVATEAVEAEVGQYLLARDVVDVTSMRCGAARPGRAPVQALDGAEVRDEAGAWQPLAVERLQLKQSRGEPVRVLVPGIAEGSEVRLRYRAGIGESWNGIPERLRQAVVRLAAHFYANRDSADAVAVPPAVRQLLAPLRPRRLR